MADPEQARAAQLRNIEAKLALSLDGLREAITASGKTKHGEIRAWLIESYGLGYGDANAVAQHALAHRGDAVPDGSCHDPLAEIYSGRKAHLRAIHEALIAAVKPWGDFEAVPKKAYVALRRKKQFAMLGPKTAERAELGINSKEAVASDRIVAQKPGGMCQYAVSLATPSEIDEELLAVLRRAYEAAG